MARADAFKAFEFFPPPPIPSVPTIALPNPHNRQPSLNKNIVLTAEHPARADSGISITAPGGKDAAPNSRNDSLDSCTSQDSSRIALPSSPLDTYSRTSTPQPPPPAVVSQSASSRRYTPGDGLSEHSAATALSGTGTLVQGDGNAAKSISPIPLRSMFPVYNPQVPLSQQSYYPQRQTSLQTRLQPRLDYGSRVGTPSQCDLVTGGLRTAPASIYNSPMDVSSIPDTSFSSPRELEKLWVASHGMEANPDVGSFNLEMARYACHAALYTMLTTNRIEEAMFTFGYDPLMPFYTLKTFDTNEILVSKVSPRKKSAVCEILQSSIESNERRILDGLVTFIFPRLAAMLAIDQANELARQHQLAPTHRDEVIQAAIQRAASQESCRLLWDAQEGRYELEHPAIGRNARSPRFVTSPTSPEDNVRPVVHISVTPQPNDTETTLRSRPPVIIVTNPLAMSSPNPNESNIRSSALPQPDIDNPLASLDFGNMTLHINAQRILELMPSLFAIDCVVSAILAVAISDRATNPVMATMDLWTASPKGPASTFGGQSVKSYAGSVFYTTLAEREEAEEEAKLMRLVHDKDVKGSKAGKSKIPKSKEDKNGRKNKKVQVAEFDIEKLSHYQSGSRKGEEMPVVTRGAMEMLVNGLKLVVWLLTAAVQMLIWLITHVTRALTSEKF